MAFALVQHGNFSGAWTNNNPLTATAKYSITTKVGSLLICVITALADYDGSSCPVPVINVPTTPGFTWTLAVQMSSDTQFFSGTNQTVQWTIAVYYITNATSMLSSATTTCSCNLSTIGAGVNSDFEFDLLELSGENISSVIDVTATGKGSGTTPQSAGNIVISNTDFVLVFASLQSFGFSAGPGYTLLDSSGSLNGIMQYILNAAPGTYATAFVPSGTGVWCCVAVGFLPASTGGPLGPFAEQPHIFIS